MGGFDFDEVVPRRHSNSAKWDDAADDDVLPLWVADMDFRAAPPVIAALERRVRHGVFGYGKVPPAYFRAVAAWFSRRHDVTFAEDWLLPVTGVVPAVSAVIRALTRPGDGVLVQEPVYNCFFSSIRNLGCTAVSNDLVYRDGVYTIDFADLEEKASDPKTTLMLLCNPHNPVGRAWTAEELTRVGEICLRHGVFVVSDEIHCDLVTEGHRHVPFASLGEAFLACSVTCVSPSKSFNLAGLQVANVVAADEAVRRKIDKALNIHEVGEIGPLGIEAAIAAYTEGDAWLDALKAYLRDNDRFLREFFAGHLPHLRVVPLEATYLVWVDCGALGVSSAEIAKRLYDRERVRINPGSLYGAAGDRFIRINIACPRSVLAEALHRIRGTLQDSWSP